MNTEIMMHDENMCRTVVLYYYNIMSFIINSGILPAFPFLRHTIAKFQIFLISDNLREVVVVEKRNINVKDNVAAFSQNSAQIRRVV